MGMMGSVLEVAIQNLRVSVKRGRSSEEGVKYSSPPLTPGTVFHGREEMYYFSAQGSSSSFIPPFQMDSSHSYFNDTSLSCKLAANLVTPADAELLRNFEEEKYKASLLEYATKVREFSP